MKKVSWYFAGAALFGAALFMIVFGRHHLLDEESRAPQADLSRRKTLPQTVRARPAPWRLGIGTELIYRLDYRGEMDQAGRTSSPQVLMGSLHIGIKSEAQGDYIVHAWIEPDKAPGPDGEATYRVLGDFIQRGVDGRLASTGFELELASDTTASDDAETQKAFWQALFGRMFAPVSLDDVGRSMTRQEKLGNIAIESSYQWLCQADCGPELEAGITLKRTMRSPSGVDPKGDPRTVEGSSVITFKPALQGISSLEVTTVETLGPVPGSFKVRSRLQLAFVEEKQGQTSLWAERELLRPAVRPSMTEGKQGDSAIDQAVIGTRDEGEILSELRQHQDLTELPQSTYLRLKSWIALHPESLTKFTQVLAAADASETVLRSFVKALGAVGHSEAQDAMVEVLGLRAQMGDGDTVDLILTGLTLVKEPTTRAEKALRELALSETPVLGRDKAKLALGAMGYHLRRSSENQDKGRALALERDMGQWLSQAKDRETKEAALGALGNLGPTDIGLLSPYMASDDPAIRARAYFALRFSPAEAASQWLVDGLLTQTSPVVRRDALEALAMRPKDQNWLSAVDKVPVARLDGSEKLLLGRSIGGARDLDTKSRIAMLERLEAEAQEPQVRQELSSYLRDLKP